MKIFQAIALMLLAASGLTGLGLLVLHWKGAIGLSPDRLTLVLVAVVALLLLVGFFLGAFFSSRQGATGALRQVMKKLRTALEAERGQRLEASRERYNLREKIVGLEATMERLKEVVRSDQANAATTPDTPARSDEPTPDQLQAQARIEELASRSEKLRSELVSRRERMVDLQAELFIAQTEVEEAKAAGANLDSSKDTDDTNQIRDLQGANLNEVLDELVSLDGIRMALVADDQGLVVDAAGQCLEPDSLAAVSGLVAELSPRVSDLLPLGEIVTVALGDVNDTVMEVRYFMLMGSRCALALIRSESPVHPGVSKNAVEVIVERLDC